MTIFVVGVNYRNTALSVRERLACVQADIFGLDESILLATCNRWELYGVGDSRLAEAYLQAWGVESCYVYHDADAVQHLMRVSAGLDSMILGEGHILGQISRALQEADTAGLLLTRLFTVALAAGKQSRAETGIGRYSTSWGRLALNAAGEFFGDVAGLEVVLIGAGEMADQVGRTLRHAKSRRLTVINRNPERGAALAGRIKATFAPWERLGEVVAKADLIITATAAPTPILGPGHVAGKRRLLVDLSLPRNIAPEVDALPQIKRIDLDHLRERLAENQERREAAILQATAIIEAESAAFFAWLAGREAVPLIRSLRERAEQIAAQEVRGALGRLALNPQEAEIVNQLAERIINKLLHEPLVYLKKNPAALETARGLFNVVSQ